MASRRRLVPCVTLADVVEDVDLLRVSSPEVAHPRSVSAASSHGSVPETAACLDDDGDIAKMATIKETLSVGDEASSMMMDGDFGRLPSLDSLTALNLCSAGLLDALSTPQRTPSAGDVGAMTTPAAVATAMATGPAAGQHDDDYLDAILNAADDVPSAPRHAAAVMAAFGGSIPPVVPAQPAVPTTALAVTTPVVPVVPVALPQPVPARATTRAAVADFPSAVAVAAGAPQQVARPPQRVRLRSRRSVVSVKQEPAVAAPAARSRTRKRSRARLTSFSSTSAGEGSATQSSSGNSSSDHSEPDTRSRPHRAAKVARRVQAADVTTASTAPAAVTTGGDDDNAHEFEGLTPAEASAKRRAMRLKRNRESAFRSRLRRKAQNEKMISELKELRIVTDDQQKDIVALQVHATALFREVQRLRQVLTTKGATVDELEPSTGDSHALRTALPPTISAAAAQAANSLHISAAVTASMAIARPCAPPAAMHTSTSATAGRAAVTMMVVMFAFAVCLFNVTEVVHQNTMGGAAPSIATSGGAATGRVLHNFAGPASGGYDAAAAALHGTAAPARPQRTLLGAQLWSPSAFATLVLHLAGVPQLAEVLIVNLVVAAMAFCTAMYLIGKATAGVIFTRPSYYAANGSTLPTSSYKVDEHVPAAAPSELQVDDDGDADAPQGSDAEDDGDDHQQEGDGAGAGAGAATFTVNGRTYTRNAMGKLMRVMPDGVTEFPRAAPRPPVDFPSAFDSDDCGTGAAADFAAIMQTSCAPPLARAASTSDLVHLTAQRSKHADGDVDDDASWELAALQQDCQACGTPADLAFPAGRDATCCDMCGADLDPLRAFLCSDARKRHQASSSRQRTGSDPTPLDFPTAPAM